MSKKMPENFCCLNQLLANSYWFLTMSLAPHRLRIYLFPNKCHLTRAEGTIQENGQSVTTLSFMLVWSPAPVLLPVCLDKSHSLSPDKSQSQFSLLQNGYTLNNFHLKTLD